MSSPFVSCLVVPRRGVLRHIVPWFAVFTVVASPLAAEFRNRDNPNLGDLGEGTYRVPYHLPRVEEIKGTLALMRDYLEHASPTRLIDSATGTEITDFTQPVPTAIADRGEEAAFNPWAYVMGVTHAALLHAAEVTGDASYTRFVARHTQFIHDRLPYFRRQAELFPIQAGAEQRGQPSERRNSFKGAIVTETLDDAGAMGAALAKAHFAGVGPDLTPLVRHLGDFVATKQFRLADGAWARRRPQPESLWADDYYMSIPLMVQLARLEKNPRHLDDAARHVLRAGERLFNRRTQLYTHGWNANQPYNPQFYWSRANGWVAMALCELLDALPAEHRDRAAVLEYLQLHFQALASLQSPSGLWRNLLDKPDSYEETSGTAMFVYALAHAINEGWISPVSYGSVAQAGWNGLASRINARGQLLDVCVGTTFASDNVYYYHRPTSPDGAHGLGPAIFAAAEMIRLLENKKVQINVQWRTYHYVPRP